MALRKPVYNEGSPMPRGRLDSFAPVLVLLVGLLLFAMAAPIAAQTAPLPGDAPLTLKSFSFDDSPLDVTLGKVPLKVEVSVMGGRGVREITIHADNFEKHSGSSFRAKLPSAGESMDVSSAVSILLPQETGTWHFTSVELSDITGAQRAYSEAELQAMGFDTSVDVVKSDSTPPALTYLGFVDAPVDMTFGPSSSRASLRIHATGIDDHSGVSVIRAILTNPDIVLPPGADAMIAAGEVRAPSEVGEVGGRLGVPGVWHFAEVSVTDKAGNTRSYGEAELRAMGFDTTIEVIRSEPCSRVTFEDCPPNSQISALAALGIVHGYGDGRFGPNDPVTRQQFAKMVTRALGLTVTTADICPFNDVEDDLDSSDDLYPDHYVAVCASRGITLGKTQTTFAPYDFLSRQQLITMTVRAACLPDAAGAPPSFGPGRFWPQEHYLNARVAYEAGLLDHLWNENAWAGFDFFRDASRGEVCAVLYNLLRSPAAVEGRAIMAAAEASVSVGSLPLTTPRLRFSGPWAGLFAAPVGESANRFPLLLRLENGSWVVIASGSVNDVAYWMDQGAPAGLADWLAENH